MYAAEDLNRELQEWKEKRYESERCRRRLQRLREERDEALTRIDKLKRVLERENEDLAKLTRLSWTNLFHTILRSKDEQVELERQQAVAAALRLQEAERAAWTLDAEIRQVQETSDRLGNPEAEYERLAKQKADLLLAEGGSTAKRLMELDESIAQQTFLMREVGEAVEAGQALRRCLRGAADSLEKAENWGRWDVAGGGMISTAVKHGHVDDAQTYVEEAYGYLNRFQQELKDLNRSLNIQLETGGFAKFADFFFDGLIADWVMQGRIRDSLAQVHQQVESIDDLLAALSRQYQQHERDKTRLEQERTALVEKSQL